MGEHRFNQRDSKLPPVTDCLGNHVYKDNLVALVMGQVVTWRVTEVKEGGLMTPQGPTPAMIKIVSEMLLVSPPGIPFKMIARVVEASQDQIVERASELLGRA